ncbi:MAG: ferrochelatase [[Chlorobium] sp. 445]|nr:MAG: ferrochelatase [[Chlorobium] sp. 445]
MKKKIAVLLVTYGEVEQLSFTHLYPNAWRILQLITSRIANLPLPLKAFIALMRTLRRRKEWKRMRYQPKLAQINRKQTTALAKRLKTVKQLADCEVQFIVKDAYYFIKPYYENVLNEVEHISDGVIVVPMIPIESDFACGVACYLMLEHLGDEVFEKVRVIKHLWNNSDFIALCVNHIFERLEARPERKKGLALVAHGTLIKDTNGEEPKANTGYKETIAFYERLKAAIERDQRNSFASIKLGAMNHKFGGTWMTETLGRALEEFKAEGIEEVVIFPFGFLADNSEADLEAVMEVQQAGYPLQYIPCLNDSPDFIDLLAGRVKLAATQLVQLQTFRQTQMQKSLSLATGEVS